MCADITWFGHFATAAEWKSIRVAQVPLHRTRRQSNGHPQAFVLAGGDR